MIIILQLQDNIGNVSHAHTCMTHECKQCDKQVSKMRKASKRKVHGQSFGTDEAKG